MKKLTSKQVRQISELADILRAYDFENVQVNLDSHWFITAERDFLTSCFIRFIPRNMSFYYSSNVLSICFN